ncbi:hypothetical protein BKA64DRAFT_411919 [Cadophora sp. MPI-SDFR-AT-0126]|nr:hypothetical protein BKA64DRAFT_411919 [Leotiomycetes sp. MPI-SDFR-AT-0126]
MDKLSVELKAMIAKITPTPDLLNLRLTSKAFYKAATQELFSRVAVTPNTASFEKFYSILASPHISQEVTGIKLTTSNDPYYDAWNLNDREIYSTLTDDYAEIIRSINRFPNLRDVALEFAEVCVYVAPDDYDKRDPEEGYEFRIDVLSAFFEALNNLQYPIPNLRSLSIKNLQNWNDKGLMSSTKFKSTLARISELRLKIITEYCAASPDAAWSYPELYTFFSDLGETWLRPAQQNLTSLALHCDIFWGYIPKCDLRSIHFPNLKKLELGNWTFSHDWQVEWICSHTTLDVLIMDDCSIVSYTRSYRPIDGEGYLLNPPYVRSTGELYKLYHTQRWSQIFAEFETRLPNLKTFQFGHGEWRNGKNFDRIGLLGSGMDSHELIYTVFDGGTNPSPWITVQNHHQYELWREESGRRDVGENFMEESEIKVDVQRIFETDEEDKNAYQKLMTTVQARK